MNKKLKKNLIFIGVCILIILTSGLSGYFKNHDLKENSSTASQGAIASLVEEKIKEKYGLDIEIETGSIVRVVDGDTLVVNVDGEDEKVRLIGINTPESVSPDENKNTEAGEIASEFTKSLVEEGETVYLQKDESDTDRYGRLLRYVWLAQPDNIWDEVQIKEKMLNAVIVINGYAEAKAYEPDVAYEDIFSDYEGQAKEDKIGLWQ